MLRRCGLLRKHRRVCANSVDTSPKVLVRRRQRLSEYGHALDKRLQRDRLLALGSVEVDRNSLTQIPTAFAAFRPHI